MPFLHPHANAATPYRDEELACPSSRLSTEAGRNLSALHVFLSLPGGQESLQARKVLGASFGSEREKL